MIFSPYPHKLYFACTSLLYYCQNILQGLLPYFSLRFHFIFQLFSKGRQEHTKCPQFSANAFPNFFFFSSLQIITFYPVFPMETASFSPFYFFSKKNDFLINQAAKLTRSGRSCTGLLPLFCVFLSQPPPAAHLLVRTDLLNAADGILEMRS